MRRTIGSWMVALALSALVATLSVPAFAAPVGRAARVEVASGPGLLARLAERLYTEVRDWFSGPGLQSATEASDGAMDPNGTSSPAPSSPSSSVVTTPSGGGLSLDG